MLGLTESAVAATPASSPVAEDIRLDRVVVINDFSSKGGGATSVALDSIRFLNARGVPVTFVTGDHGRCDLPSAIEIVALGGSHILSGNRLGAALRGLHDGAASRLVAGWIADRDTPGTVYHLHGWSKILSPSIFRALRPVASRLTITAHDFFLACPNGGYFNYRRGNPCDLRPLGLRCLASSCDRRHYGHKAWRFLRQVWTRASCDLGRVGAIIVVHEGMIPHLEHGGIPRSQIVPLRNPVTPCSETRIPSERNATFVFVGRLDQDKGVDLLVEAARRADVPLQLIGDGELAGSIASQFPEVELLGWRSQSEVAARLREARALVVPTRCRETFGIVAIEALRGGLPIVVSKHALIAEEVAMSGFGLLCDPHDMSAFVLALKRLSGDHARIEAMSRRAHAHSRWLAPTPREWVEQLLSLYARVLEQSREALA